MSITAEQQQFWDDITRPANVSCNTCLYIDNYYNKCLLAVTYNDDGSESNKVSEYGGKSCWKHGDYKDWKSKKK